MCQSHNYCCWVFLCWVIFFTWLYYNLIYLILFFKILKGNNCGSCFWTWQHYVLFFFLLWFWPGHQQKGKTWRVSCRASWSYGIWGLISYSIVSHCWFHYSITFQVVARRSVTLSAQLFNMFSVAFLEGGSTSKQIIEYCITPESLIVITQNCLGIKYANMSRKIINVTANSDYTEGWKKGIREFKRIF